MKLLDQIFQKLGYEQDRHTHTHTDRRTRPNVLPLRIRWCFHTNALTNCSASGHLAILIIQHSMSCAACMQRGWSSAMSLILPARLPTVTDSCSAVDSLSFINRHSTLIISAWFANQHSTALQHDRPSCSLLISHSDVTRTCNTHTPANYLVVRGGDGVSLAAATVGQSPSCAVLKLTHRPPTVALKRVQFTELYSRML